MKRFLVVILAMFCFTLTLAAKEKKQDVTNEPFDATAAQVYEAAYKYVQHNGVIKYSDDKHMTITAMIHLRGGNWGYAKDFECTISVESTKDNKASVEIVGYATGRSSLSDMKKKNAPAYKVLEGIHAEFDSTK